MSTPSAPSVYLDFPEKKYAALSTAEIFGEIRSALAAQGPQRFEDLNMMILSRPESERPAIINYCKEHLGDYILRTNYARFKEQWPLGNMINFNLSFLQNMALEEFMPFTDWLAINPSNMNGFFSKNPYHRYLEITEQQIACRGLFLKHFKGGKMRYTFQHFAPSEVVIFRMDYFTKTFYLDLSTLPSHPQACIILASRRNFTLDLKTEVPYPVIVYTSSSDIASEVRLERSGQFFCYQDEELDNSLGALFKAPIDVFTPWLKHKNTILSRISSLP